MRDILSFISRMRKRNCRRHRPSPPAPAPHGKAPWGGLGGEGPRGPRSGPVGAAQHFNKVVQYISKSERDLHANSGHDRTPDMCRPRREEERKTRLDAT